MWLNDVAVLWTIFFEFVDVFILASQPIFDCVIDSRRDIQK